MKLINAFPKVIHVGSLHFLNLFMDLTHITVAENDSESRSSKKRREKQVKKARRENKRDSKIHACKDVDLRLRNFTVMWKRLPSLSLSVFLSQKPSFNIFFFLISKS